MHRSGAGATAPGPADRPARIAERVLRLLADARVALALLLLAGIVNALAAALPDGAWLLATPPYLVLLGAVACLGVAAVAVRAPAAWREWRHPGPVPEGPEALVAEISLEQPLVPAARAGAVAALRAAGYRVRETGEAPRWTLAGTRRGWSRFAGQLAHLALVVMLVGAALGNAFSHETTFSLLPGEQALLDEPRPGFTSALRLDAFDAEFGADGRPLRLDATVTFLRNGEDEGNALVQVNQPGAFDGYLVHGWTYGPAARIRVTTLGGQPLRDAPIPLDAVLEGRPAAFAELPSLGLTLGLVLADADANQLSVTAADASGVLDSVRLVPGQQQRLGPVMVRLDGFDAYLTFVSRRDPGMGLLFAGAGLLVASLAVAFWLPRRRVTLRPAAAGLRLVLRGERFDRPDAELARLRASLAHAVGAEGGR
jgi:cytochrome c biogenesis protein ResB